MQRLQILSHTWFHVPRHEGFAILRTHPMASWSGVYCVVPGEVPEDRPESGVLRFHNPHHSNYFLDSGNLKFRPPTTTALGASRFRAWQLVLFPSWLRHEALPFYGWDEPDHDRVQLLFGMKDGA